jgi:hypothetical protein
VWAPVPGRKIALTYVGAGTFAVLVRSQGGMSGPECLREQAARCRRLADGIDDARTIATLRQMADDFERQAATDESQNEIPPPISN